MELVPSSRAVKFFQSSSTAVKPLIEVKPKRAYKGNEYLGVGLYVYHKCNVRCDYCFWFRDFDINESMSESTYKRVIDELLKRDKVHLNLLGGEPTFYPYLNGIIEYALDSGLTDFIITTNFIRPLEFFNKMPRLAEYSLAISIHLDAFKDKPDDEFARYLDNIEEFCKNKPGKRNRIGVVIDERYMDRLLQVLERIKDIRAMKYPILATYETYDYYKVSQPTVDIAKPYFSELFYKYMINDVEHDMLDDAVNNGPNFQGYWCNLNTVEIFPDGTTRTTCTDKYVGNIIKEDDVVKNYNPLHRCTVKLCDNFNRIMLKKTKYGKYT